MTVEETARATCRSCGYVASLGSETWGSVTHSTLSNLTNCPECGSTDIPSRTLNGLEFLETSLQLHRRLMPLNDFSESDVFPCLVDLNGDSVSR